jgi:protein SCO1/2
VNSINERLLLSVAAVCTTVAIAAGLTTRLVSADNARWGAGYFPNVTLTTHEGKRVRFYDDLVKGKIVAIDLIYTTCKYACPLETARMVQVQRALGDRVGRDIFFYSMTIDPEHDTPAVLKDYAEKYHVGPGWQFLTGSAADIDLLSKKLGLYSEPDPSNPDGHTPMLLIGNEVTGQWLRNSALDNPKFLARTIGDWLNSWESGAKEALKPFAEAPSIDNFDQGQYTFRNHCAACHTIGGGDAIGPDLKDVTAIREPQWLRRFIATPEKLLDEHDPIATALLARFKQVRMPNLYLTDADAALLTDYLARASGDTAAAASMAPMRSMGSMPDAAPRAATPSRAPAKAPVSAADFDALLDPYFRIQQALANDSFVGVSDSALALATAAMKLGSRGAAVKAAVNPFAQASDVVTARAAFGGLSEAILRLANASGVTFADRAAIAYCPMARKYWLQKGDTVQNPYYGKQMSDCGRIVSDIAKVE